MCSVCARVKVDTPCAHGHVLALSLAHPALTCPQHTNRAGGTARSGHPGAQPTPGPGPTCAAEGHGAHRSQVDGISLVTREELQPHVADADEEEGAQG